MIRIDEKDIGRHQLGTIKILIAEETKMREGFGRLLLPCGTASDDADGQRTR